MEINKKIMKLTYKDLTVVLLVVLGVLGSINWLEIPFWVYLLVLFAYAGLRLAGKESNNVSNYRSVGGELPPEDEEGPL